MEKKHEEKQAREGMTVSWAAALTTFRACDAAPRCGGSVPGVLCGRGWAIARWRALLACWWSPLAWASGARGSTVWRPPWWRWATGTAARDVPLLRRPGALRSCTAFPAVNE